MGDEPTPDATSGADGAKPNAGQGDPGTGAGTTTSTTTQTDDHAAANAKEALARVAKERDEARAALKQLRDKDLPEAEKAARRIAELEAAEKNWSTERQDLRMETQAVRLAGKLGYADADDAIGWLARNRSQVEFDDKGQPTNLEKLLRDLLKTKPHWQSSDASRTRGTAEGGARGQGAPVDFNQALRRSAGRS